MTPSTKLSDAIAAPLAALIAIVSAVGILHPAIYDAETEAWAAQAIGQDWGDAVLAVPWLVLAGRAARRGSRRGRLLLVGGYAFAAYTFVIYGFGVHFNAMFLVYCATLGLSVLGLVAGLAALVGGARPGWVDAAAPVRLAAGWLIAPAVAFALLWLGDVAPAIARGDVPASIAGTGLLTNPVHVLDLSIVLPAMFAGGVLLARRRPLGLVAGPVLLGFSSLMAASIAVMLVVSVALGVGGSLVVAGALAGLAVGTGAVLVALLRHVADR